MNNSPIISKHIRVRCPDHFKIGIGSIVDDFCYFSTRVTVGKYSHIANGCSVAGGSARLFTLGDFSSISAGVKIWCASDDFVNDLVTIIPPGVGQIKENFIEGDVEMEQFTAVGSNSVIMPGVHLPEGTVIGALSFVPAFSKLEGWSVYAGVPVRKICDRNKEAVNRQKELLESRLQEQE